MGREEVVRSSVVFYNPLSLLQELDSKSVFAKDAPWVKTERIVVQNSSWVFGIRVNSIWVFVFEVKNVCIHINRSGVGQTFS